MAIAEEPLTLALALDPSSWRAHDKLAWASNLINVVETAAPYVWRVEGYELGDTMLYVRLRTNQKRAQMRKLLRHDEKFMRLRVRLADLGARPEFQFERL